ncbi:AIG2 family protein [Haloterrigena turkmenica DSM 5511]|uniref:AIG2 family protein n=1 Tax=Haloterrigena turkmenica (strain ATCC 51198 / DSM 5511 / JCM 9101 / NCIMB 13204 / VKM B-1734 / 4k) TaxID=543526 RepID=D2RYT4_HALTV|nr:gamma-glutamylcyclotransferase family protein [Haloterrigena turkmenica]ADB61902.1 AIG2 family protein [Haloterrigena turkmenica DSM 5511]
MLVFVYGTLTDPERVASLLEDGPGEYEFAGPATLEGLHRVDGRYPTLVPGGSVEGRLLAVDEPALERLDRYEGVDRDLYVRVAVSGPDDRRVWIYVGDPGRLGAHAADGWPDDRPFRDAVRAAIVPNTTVVRRDE